MNSYISGLDEAANDTLELSQALQDNMRKDYIHDHLCSLSEAIQLDTFFLFKLFFRYLFRYSQSLGCSHRMNFCIIFE